MFSLWHLQELWMKKQTCYSAFDVIIKLANVYYLADCLSCSRYWCDWCWQRPQHPQRRCLCVLICCHTLTTRCSALCIKSVYCFVPSPVFVAFPRLIYPHWSTKRQVFFILYKRICFIYHTRTYIDSYVLSAIIQPLLITIHNRIINRGESAVG